MFQKKKKEKNRSSECKSKPREIPALNEQKG